MISSFLLQDVPRHDTRLFEVRETFKRTLLLGFRACISAYIAKKKSGLRGPLRGACATPAAGVRATRLESPVAVPATDAGPLINALVHSYMINITRYGSNKY